MSISSSAPCTAQARGASVKGLAVLLMLLGAAAVVFPSCGGSSGDACTSNADCESNKEPAQCPQGARECRAATQGLGGGPAQGNYCYCTAVEGP